MAIPHIEDTESLATVRVKLNSVIDKANTAIVAETDPVFESHVASDIESSHIDNWNTAYNWGDHSTQGYLTEQTAETDPVFVASPAYSIDSSHITNWNTAYNWGDHSVAGYLTEQTAETDPVFVASPAYSIDSTHIDNWNAKLTPDDILDILTSTKVDKALSANQGRLLKIAIDNINAILESDDTDLDTLQEIVDFIKLNRSELEALQVENIAGLQSSLDYKVDKIEGKGLSTEDFTTPEKNKLAGIADNANNYVHPVSHPAEFIVESNDKQFVSLSEKNNFNTAYSWGDHSVAGYLTSYEETDPVFVASPANSIDSSHIDNWNTAYSWGDHSVAGYLTEHNVSDKSLLHTRLMTSKINAVTALEIDCSEGMFFTKTIDGESTFTFTNVPSGAYLMTVQITHTSGTITWPTVQWPEGTAPTVEEGATHLFLFSTTNAGATWRGAAVAGYV